MKERETDTAFGGKVGNSHVMGTLVSPAEDSVFLFEWKRGKEVL